jgi:hypothetical protein
MTKIIIKTSSHFLCRARLGSEAHSVIRLGCDERFAPAHANQSTGILHQSDLAEGRTSKPITTIVVFRELPTRI